MQLRLTARKRNYPRQGDYQQPGNQSSDEDAGNQGIPTHFVEEISDRETVVKRVKIIPLEVIVRNIAAGSLSKRLGIPGGKKLAKTVLEYSYKDDELGDPMINDYHVFAMELATRRS